MFGENTIYGRTELNIDGKKRLCIPKFTYAEPEDSLIIKKEQDFISVYEAQYYDKLITELEQNLITSFGILNGDKIKIELLKEFQKVLKKVKVDSYRRIVIGDIVSNKKKVLCIGAKDHIVII